MLNKLSACTTGLIGMGVRWKSERRVQARCTKSSRPLTHLQDRYAGLSGPGTFRGGLRGGLRGSRGGGLRGGFRGGLRGGFQGQGAGRDFSQDLYADYSGPDQQQAGGLRMDGYSGPPSGPAAQFGGGGGGGGGYSGGFDTEPSQQIMVRNVCTLVSNPFS